MLPVPPEEQLSFPLFYRGGDRPRFKTVEGAGPVSACTALARGAGGVGSLGTGVSMPFFRPSHKILPNLHATPPGLPALSLRPDARRHLVRSLAGDRHQMPGHRKSGSHGGAGDMGTTNLGGCNVPRPDRAC